MLDFVRKYFNVVVLLVICLSLKGCKKSHILDENEEHVKDIAENFTDALIAQNDDKIISYINETADEYYEHINISSLVKSVLDEQPKNSTMILTQTL